MDLVQIAKISEKTFIEARKELVIRFWNSEFCTISERCCSRCCRASFAEMKQVHPLKFQTSGCRQMRMRQAKYLRQWMPFVKDVGVEIFPRRAVVESDFLSSGSRCHQDTTNILLSSTLGRKICRSDSTISQFFFLKKDGTWTLELFRNFLVIRSLIQTPVGQGEESDHVTPRRSHWHKVTIQYMVGDPLGAGKVNSLM